MTNSADEKVLDIIYIMGSGRSGSTLLSSMLGSQRDIVCAGEVYNYMNFFESAEARSRKCSCGEALLQCDYWQQIRDRLKQQKGTELLDLKDTDRHTFDENNHALLSAIRDVSGKPVIVDSSKRHYRLKLLLKSGLFRVTIVHLIRDARAYAYSSLVTARKNGESDTAYYKKILQWQKKNIGIKAIYGRHPRYVQMRYEDLVRNHEAELERVMRLCDLTLDTGRVFDPSVNQSHEFSGNSGFISKGLDEIKLDTRYLESLSARQWLVSSTLVAPCLTLFGYPVFSRGVPA